MNLIEEIKLHLSQKYPGIELVMDTKTNLTGNDLLAEINDFATKALKNMDASSRIIHSQPTEGFNYWIRQDAKHEWKVAEARQCRIYNRIMLFTTNGARVDPKYCDWRANPLPIPKG